ncbi:TetR/AcrR family transcriptional regulator [Amycolatopsis taiwanensis]|uniref:TetR/AcrR family transcriptional regulator n=1 Tax=Amycolatopsis taiwanensis TaxID=342230 RepID=UPI000481ED2A|nr:TetR/AcrR family transcriptional regulator [Amycolatopsis taiwanensis]
MVKQGLREQKKQETRRTIANIATGLFFRYGFDNVTVADIAEAAGVSKMTVFNYFPRKEDLFLDRHADRLRDLEMAIRERDPAESVISAMRRYHQELLAAQHPLSGAIEGARPFFQVVRSSPALISRTYEHQHEIRDMLADVLAEEMADRAPAELLAALLTATIYAIFDRAVNRILAGEDVADVRREQTDFIDRAFDLLEHGVAGI